MERERTRSYEQPLNERMRTFLRLEFLYQQPAVQPRVGDELGDARGRRSSGLLEIMAILMRGDVRSEVLKELERQIDNALRCSDSRASPASTSSSASSELLLKQPRSVIAGNQPRRSARSSCSR